MPPPSSAFTSRKTPKLCNIQKTRVLSELLSLIDSKRYATSLIEHLPFEQSETVRFAIGRVLASVEASHALRSGFGSKSAKVREAACFSAGWVKDGEELVEKVRLCLEDESESVITRALEALDRISKRKASFRLSNSIKAEPELKKRWIYLDALVTLVDPGDEQVPWQSELLFACEDLSPLIRSFVIDQLKVRRKSLLNELKRKDKLNSWS